MKKMTFSEMENVQAGMACWVAKSLLIGAGVALTFTTAGWGTLLLNGFLLAGAELGMLESCFSKMLI
jgi:hypothetical protein